MKNVRFRTASDTPRPIRLSDPTRLFAWESLNGRYGKEAMETPAVSMDNVPDWENLSRLERYDRAVRAIAEQAPVRVVPGERVSGAATLGLAIEHRVPATYGGKSLCSSVSHLTIDYERVLKYGVNHLDAMIDERLADKTLTAAQRAEEISLKRAVESMRVWHRRYLDATKTLAPDTHALLTRVPFEPARTFAEAVQAIWFEFAFARLTGNWPGIGRLDEMLAPYYAADRSAGRITPEEAREILASFFIKGCEWIRPDVKPEGGDAQHYQNIVLGGVDTAGREVTNDVTYLILDVVEETGIADFPISVRIRPDSPKKLLRKAARVARHGGGAIAFYNENVVLAALTKAGYPLAEARRFANDGCWEVQVPGSTNFNYFPLDALVILDSALGLEDGAAAPDYPDMESLYQAYLAHLDAEIAHQHTWVVMNAYDLKEDGAWHVSLTLCPSTVIDLFERGCIERGAPYYEFGPDYTVRSAHLGQAPDAGNALYAIDELVFKRKIVTLPELIEILKNNWEGSEALRLYARNKLTYYGNDEDASDCWTARLLDDYAKIVHAYDAKTAAAGGPPVRYLPGVSTFGRQIEWAPKHHAVAFGFRAGEYLANNSSPTPGTDEAGATAIIASYAKADGTLQTTGSALEVRLAPSSLRGRAGVDAIVSLLNGFVALGGNFIQLDAVDAATLIEAQKHPENYRTLSVRVAGWNARFVTLDKNWQDMLIERTVQGE